MSIFVDKKFEELDWISRAVEPVVSTLSDIIEYLPEEIEITKEMMSQTLKNGRHDINIIDILLKQVKPEHLDNISTHQDRSYLAGSYVIDFRREDGSAYSEDDEENYLDSGPLIIKYDSETDHLSGSVFLKKNSTGLNEKEISTIFGAKGYDAVNSIRSWSANTNRIKEIVDLLGEIQGLEEEKTSSVKKKLLFLRKKFREVVKKNTFNIKSVDLMNKMGEWIFRYITEGDEVALANICKLKIMSTMGSPIYSMEIEVAKDDAR
jgi:hypothetical protein